MFITYIKEWPSCVIYMRHDSARLKCLGFEIGLLLAGCGHCTRTKILSATLLDRYLKAPRSQLLLLLQNFLPIF